LISEYKQLEENFDSVKVKLASLYNDFVEKIVGIIEQMHKEFDRCLVINDKTFAQFFQTLTENYE